MLFAKKETTERTSADAQSEETYIRLRGNWIFPHNYLRRYSRLLKDTKLEIKRGESSVCGTLSIPPSYIFQPAAAHTPALSACTRSCIFKDRRAASRLGKVVYPSSFNYLINSVSSIIFARVIKPQAKVNNS